MRSGDTFGKYRLVHRLGQGGMGEVWLATASGHGGFTKTVVIKTLLPEFSRDPMFIEMLAHEARICAQLSHPNLIEVFDFAEHDGCYLLAMEHVVGRSFHHIVRAAKDRSWVIPAWFALRVAWECCRGLEYAHAQGIIHCDLSPSNVMVTFAGTTKILDFGVAHSITHGPKADRLKGKVAYLAPERIKSLETDCRSDIYSLGVMLYLIFTGQLPFIGASDREVLQKVVEARPRLPSELAVIDPRIERLILRAMQPDPAQRHQNMRQVLDELSPCLEGQLGTHGQQDVAEYLVRLFADEGEPAPRTMPPIPPPPRAAGELSDLVTRFSADEVHEMDEFDIEVASSVLEIPVAPARPIGEPPRPPPRAPSATPRDVSKMFDRPPRQVTERRGGFGSYSSARLPHDTTWPWASSRTKSD